jgi:3-deoxy-D-arabino-heptulosonate 7-phosphate (DAHP) synthase
MTAVGVGEGSVLRDARETQLQTPADPAGVCNFRVLRRQAESSTVRVGGVRIADGEFTVVAGPCSVESRGQILETAHVVRSLGATMLRGGAFKPRTSPYAFQGLGWAGIALLADAGRSSGLPTVSEVMTIDSSASRNRSTSCKSAPETCRISTC